MIFQPDTVVSGFRITEVKEIPDIESTAYLGIHEASGARLLYLANADEDKTFAIGFKTPPQDHTGVFHILEHSVLCGSKHFPVKEPFVNLLQCSMQTFLNAMTFPDKTLYPVASTNQQDLENLADVYLDAVLNPVLLSDPQVFAQEGWHYELTEGKLAYNGVVFNEMKGALSDPEEVLGDALREELFPDTCYRFESGGRPDAIPELTYEQFLAEYKQHYQLSNSYIILYGDLDARRMLAFIDERHLTPWVAEHANHAAPAPREITLQEPVYTEGRTVELVTTPDNSMAALAYVVPGKRDTRKLLATGLLLSALAGTNESPLRRALLDADLADSVTFPFLDEILQPYVTVQLRGLHEGAKERFKPTFESILREQIAAGFDKEALLASITREEFSLRERDFSVSSGVIYAMSALSTWLYDDEAATDGLVFTEHLAALKEAVAGDYFERLAAEIFLENNHVAAAYLTPVEPEAETEEDRRLAAVLAGMDEAARARVDEKLAALRARQEAEDSPEALATLPMLSLADLGEARKRPGWHTAPARRNGDTLLIHEVPTAGIGYFSVTFPLPQLHAEELPYLAVLARMLGKLDTATHSALELDTFALLHLGGFSFVASILGSDTDDNAATPCLSASASALVPESATAAAYLAELLQTTDFSDTGRMKTILAQWRMRLEDNFINAGHTLARAQVGASLRKSAAAADALSGIGFYAFLCDLLDNWEEKAPSLPGTLTSLAERVWGAGNLTISLAGGEEAAEAFMGALTEALPAMPDAGDEVAFTAPELRPANAAYTTPGNVTFTALGTDYAQLSAALGKTREEAAGIMSDGSWEVARNILNYDALWNSVRVKGGAYGAGFTKDPHRDMCFHSYRDPHVDETLERFAEAADALATSDMTAEDLEGFIIGAVSAFDAPVRPRALINAQRVQYLMSRDPEARYVRRAQALATTPEHVRELGTILAVAVPHMHSCTVGNADIINAATSPAQVIPLVKTSAE